ncbi:MAG: ATP-binding protein [Pseudomonadota bacterium]
MPKIWSRKTVAMPLSVTAIWCMVVYALFLWVARSEADHVRELALSQARTLFTQLVSTRAWNAMYGGVFVLEDERNRPNLDLPENQRAVETSEGMRLIRVNPAYMTRQIAEIVNSRQGVTFHITSLDPVRTANAPDDWETAALRAFNEGETEVFALCEHGQMFRYMAPLQVDSTCWDCHYVEPKGILRPDRPQESYELKAMGPADSQTVDSQTADSQTADSQTADSQTADSQTVDTQTADAQAGTNQNLDEARSPLALAAMPQGDELVALAEACPEVDAEASGNALGTVTNISPSSTRPIPSLRGGISVSMAAGPLLAVEAGRVRILAMTYGAIGLLGVIGIGGATLIMSRRQVVAEAANRTKGTFLANMSHDMRTPLAGMLGMVELMQSPQCTEDKRMKYLSMLRGSADGLLEIVNDITDFSRLEAGKMSLCMQPFVVRDELATAVNLFRFSCEQKDLVLHVHVDTNVPERLVGDAFRLRQALGNLLANAVKFTEEGRVDVTLHVLEWHENPVLHFGVRDTGCGIAEEEHERIFDSFVQSIASRQNRTVHSGGSGLGLAIVREIAQLFGGQAGLESQLGRGSFFWFTACLSVPNGEPDEKANELDDIPCACQDTVIADKMPSVSVASSKSDFTILVADDNPVVRLFSSEILRQAGYTVLLAEHGDAALDILRQGARQETCQPIGQSKEQTCHLALLDVRMPKRSGIELLRLMRSGKVLGVPADLPIYMVTASALCDEEELRGTADADGVLLKPMQASALRELVDGVFMAWTEKMQSEGVIMAEDMPSSCAPIRTHIWNKAAALHGVGGNEALLYMLIKAFMPEAEARRQRIAVALAQSYEDSVQVLRDEAHALANSAGVLCCTDLLSTSKSLEKAALSWLNLHAREELPYANARVPDISKQAQTMLAAFDAVLEVFSTVLQDEFVS